MSANRRLATGPDSASRSYPRPPRHQC